MCLLDISFTINSAFAYLVYHTYVLHNKCSDANAAAQLTPMVSVYASRVFTMLYLWYYIHYVAITWEHFPHYWPRGSLWIPLTNIKGTVIRQGLPQNLRQHYDDVVMTILASQITRLTVVCSIVYSGVNQRKHQSSASLAFVREIHRGPVNFPHKWPVTRKMFPFDDVIMCF